MSATHESSKVAAEPVQETESTHFIPSAFHRRPPTPPPPPTVHEAPSTSPLGLLSFAVTLFAFGLYQCGAGLPSSSPAGYALVDQAVFGLAVFYGGAAQFLAGVMEFRLGNIYSSTMHCSYGAYWLAYSMILLPASDPTFSTLRDASTFGTSQGIFFLLWFLLTIVFVLAALKTSYVVMVTLGLYSFGLFLLSVARFILGGHEKASASVNKAGGVFAVFAATAAFYAGAASLLVLTGSNVKLPTGDIPAARKTTRDKSTV